MNLPAEFLSQIRRQVRHRHGDSLRSWLQVEPGSPAQYHELGAQLRLHFSTNAKMERLVETHLPLDDDEENDDDDDSGATAGGNGDGDAAADGLATAWPGLQSFIKDYLVFWRDIDYDDLLGAHQLLSGLVNSCSTAFAHPAYGAMLLHTCMSLSETLVRLTMMLNRRPDLTRKLRVAATTATGSSSGMDEDKSVAESSAEIIQKIFTTCLTDRSNNNSSSSNGLNGILPGSRTRRLRGKKTGVYMFANLVLKLLLACRRTQPARIMFASVAASTSPPLALYPAAQRVTYLYHLGRFHLAAQHYRRAALCLEAAYRQTPAYFVPHRAAVLTFLLPANLLLGRFPAHDLLARPEASQLNLAPSSSTPGPTTLRSVFLPLCHAVRQGNFVACHAHLDSHHDWLLQRGLLLPLSSRLRPLLWRGLARKAFLLTYVAPVDDALPPSSSRKAATLDLAHLHALAVYQQRRLEGWELPSSTTPASPRLFRRPPPGQELLVRAVSNNLADQTAAATAAATTLVPPAVVRALRPNEGLVWGNAEVTLELVEMTVAALVQQGLLHGYVAHAPHPRFAIVGAKAKGSPLRAGWPDVWQAICDRRYDEPFDLDHVPGWVR